jgi:hypothetical protein
MGKFTGMKDAKVGQGGVYFLEGKYRVKVAKVFMLGSRKSGDLFTVEAVILASTNPQRPVGLKGTWQVKMGQDMSLPNIKGFLAACNGANPGNDKEVLDCFTDKAGNDVSEETAEMAVGDDNPLAGVEVDLTVVMITTKGKGLPFSKHEWSPVRGHAFGEALSPAAAA